ncbi:MAG: hypothetical protein HYX60_01790 [Legionella longbeachae]|nr:hypothetical protein [Legionella longbeachae]
MFYKKSEKIFTKKLKQCSKLANIELSKHSKKCVAQQTSPFFTSHNQGKSIKEKKEFLLKNKPVIETKNQAESYFKELNYNRLESLGLLPTDMDSKSFIDRMDSIRVFYQEHLFHNNLQGNQAFSLNRAITKTAAIDLQASDSGEMQSGEPWPGKDFFMDLKPGDDGGLSTEERIIGRKKCIASKGMIYRYGGYPMDSSINILKEPQSVFILSMPGLQFEHPQLDYKICIIDAHNQPEKHQTILSQFACHDKEAMLRYMPLRGGGFSYIQRKAKGEFTSGLSMRKAIFLDREAYFNELVEDFIILFKSAENMVDKSKKIYLKLPFRGMGYFAIIDSTYDIKNYLISIYLDALDHVLKVENFPQIAVIECAVFGEEMRQVVDLCRNKKENKINNIELFFPSNSDSLDFTGISAEQYHYCVANPSDVNSYPGNEIGYSINHPTSVESAIGNNTDIRYIQNHSLNPALLDIKNWIGISTSIVKRRDLINDVLKNNTEDNTIEEKQTCRIF